MNKIVKDQVSKLRPSATLAINEESNKLEKSGKKVYKFGFGQSPFHVPESVVIALKNNANKHMYLPMQGLEELRSAISNHLNKNNNNDFQYNDIVIGPGLLIPSKEDSQFEHRFVNKLGYGLIRSFPISLIEYKTVSTLTEWNPNFTVNITSEYIRKVEATKAFVSQKDKAFFSDTVLEQFHTDYRLSRRGIRYSEQFKILECFE